MRADVRVDVFWEELALAGPVLGPVGEVTHAHIAIAHCKQKDSYPEDNCTTSLVKGCILSNYNSLPSEMFLKGSGANNSE